MGSTTRPGRVSADKKYKPAPRKRALVLGPNDGSHEDSRISVEAGLWLKALREERGISQKDFCTLLGIDPVPKPAFVSAIENGRVRIKSKHYANWAGALAMPAREFVVQLLRFYSPIVFEVLLKDEVGSTQAPNSSP